MKFFGRNVCLSVVGESAGCLMKTSKTKQTFILFECAVSQDTQIN